MLQLKKVEQSAGFGSKTVWSSGSTAGHTRGLQVSGGLVVVVGKLVTVELVVVGTRITKHARKAGYLRNIHLSCISQ